MPDPAASRDQPAVPRRRVLAGLLALALVVCLGYTAAELTLLSGDIGFPLDDSWIHLQFARNLASGEGLSYNAGEPVSGSTAPLWTALLSLVFLLPGGPVIPVKLLGVGLHVASVAATVTLGRELRLSAGTLYLAAGWTLATLWLVWSALSGLEIPLFVLMSLWGIVWHLRERRTEGAVPRSLALFAASALARPEGLLLFVLAVADRFLRFDRDESADGGSGAFRWKTPEIRPLLHGAALALLLLVPVVLFNLSVAGSPLPTTFAAKTSGSGTGLPSTGYLYAILSIFFRPLPVATLAAGAGALALLARLGGRRDRGLLPALWLFGLPLAYSALSPAGGPVLAGNFGRYYFPLFPLLALLGAYGLERSGRALGASVRFGALRLPWRSAVVALLFWPTAVSLVQGSGRYVQSVANVRDSDLAMAGWLAERLPPEAVLAVNDIGALKFFLPENRILDLAGIAHPEAERYRRREVASGGTSLAGSRRFLEEHRPDYLVIFPNWFPGLLEPGSGYRPLYRLEIKNNITMGGNALVVAATPWTRFPLRDAVPAPENGSGEERGPA